ADYRAGRQVQVDVVENFRTIETIAKRDVLEADIAVDPRQPHPPRIVVRFGRGIEDVAETRDRQTRLMEILPRLCEAQHRGAYVRSEHVEGDELADREIALDDEFRSDVQNG